MFDYDYVIAKLHARHSRSPLIARMKELSESPTIERFYQAVFPGESFPGNPAKLYTLIQNRYKKTVYDEINRISGYFLYQNAIVNSYILKYEIDNIKLMVKYHLSGRSSIENLFEVQLKNALDYSKIYQENISEFSVMEKILNKTPFKFVLPMIADKQPLYRIENRLDHFYYSSLMECLREYSPEEILHLLNILKMEMNFQNITWAMRLKYYYKKKFDEVSDTFLTLQGLIPVHALEELMNMQFIPGEAEKLTSLFPAYYRKLIRDHINADGDPMIHDLENDLYTELFTRYRKNFYTGFEIASIISYINLKINEYYQLVRMVETLRYRED